MTRSLLVLLVFVCFTLVSVEVTPPAYAQTGACSSGVVAVQDNENFGFWLCLPLKDSKDVAVTPTKARINVDGQEKYNGPIVRVGTGVFTDAGACAKGCGEFETTTKTQRASAGTHQVQAFYGDATREVAAPLSFPFDVTASPGDLLPAAKGGVVK